LAQRIYRIGAHCQFSQPEMIKAFDDLVTWVRQGTRPDGDEVLGDLRNAGLKFTTPLRANDPGGVTIAPKTTVQGQAQAPQARRFRALPIQQCFDSGFPHGKDQFISAAASNRAAMALARAIQPGS
jgi:hypothetical protein